jgi:hypothetical protein
MEFNPNFTTDVKKVITNLKFKVIIVRNFFIVV